MHTTAKTLPKYPATLKDTPSNLLALVALSQQALPFDCGSAIVVPSAFDWGSVVVVPSACDCGIAVVVPSAFDCGSVVVVH